MNEYDIGEVFQRIEDELIASMMRNMGRHRAEERAEGYEWTMWQAEQLKSLEKYKKENARKYGKQFRDINRQIEMLLRKAYATGGTSQERAILEAIKKGFKGARKASPGMTGEFFKLNKRKLEALIDATTNDVKKAEHAVLRQANDQYRQAIYNAQVYANTGAGTYEKAVDMATKDMLSRGITCVEYKNGSRHTLADYADMAIRTASKRAYLTGEGAKRQEWGIYTVIVNKRGNPCPKCLPHCGKVYIDDVWSGGPKSGISPETGNKYPLISEAIDGGLYHPRCKDSHTTYFEGISTPPDPKYTKKQVRKIEARNRQEAKEQYVERQVEKYERLAEYSLDDENQERYRTRREEWKRIRARKADSIANVVEKVLETSMESSIIKTEATPTVAMAKRIPDRAVRSKIIREAIEADKPVYAADLRSVFGKITPRSGFYDCCLHGTQYYAEYEKVYKIDAETLAYIIRGRRDYKGGPIRLLSCSTGAEDSKGNCFAQYLADLLGEDVLAPVDTLNIYRNGMLTVGEDDLPEALGFKPFHPRERKR